jgi:hypothetical protein
MYKIEICRTVALATEVTHNRSLATFIISESLDTQSVDPP